MPVPEATIPGFGPEIRAGSVLFRLWAPKHETIVLEVERFEPRPMRPVGGGWHEAEVAGAGPGSLYRFVLPDGLRVPDPGSRYQPHDVHGPSEVVDPDAYSWHAAAWRGRPWEECVLYELHVGTFTPEGTFRAAIERLDHLAALGITAVQLMPVADFPGTRNWGYDGVLPFAPDAAYGRPEDLKALVDAAHERGLMVLLDVVYNHFGPDGNYLPTYSPVFTERHHTPWGAAVNFDGHESDPVRDFVIQNAIYWIDEFRFDGLRLDAVHAIIDDGPTHLLTELARRVRAAAPGREIHLVLENEENQAALLERDAGGRPRLYTAQWNDDVHHVLHTAASGESAGYYAEYAGDAGKLGRALAEGFAFQGEMMTYRGEARGEPSAHLPPTAFVSFIQNHDQVGNRAFGDRLNAFAPAEAVRAVSAVCLLAPQIPMLFMGEEWGASQPFPFFCDFGPDLSDAVREGRIREFARFPEFQDPAARERIPDPTSPATFALAKLDWAEPGREPHAAALARTKWLLAVRRREIVPRLGGLTGNAGTYETPEGGGVLVSWRLGDGARLVLEANLSVKAVPWARAARGAVLWSEGAVGESELGPWSVVWSLT